VWAVRNDHIFLVFLLLSFYYINSLGKEVIHFNFTEY